MSTRREVRDRAIQTVAGHTFRDRFRINPRCVEFVRTPWSVERRDSRLILEAIRTGATCTFGPNKCPAQVLTHYGIRFELLDGSHESATISRGCVQRRTSAKFPQ